MKPYSTDLRERVVQSVETGDCTIPEAAERFAVSIPSVERWLARQRRSGTCAPLPHAGGPKRVLASAETVLREAITVQPDASLAELCAVVKKRLRLTADASMMCRELQRLRLPRKKRPFTPANAPQRVSNSAVASSSRKSKP